MKKEPQIISPEYSFKGTLPSLHKSALISIGGVGICLIALSGIKFALPNQDFGVVEASIATAVSAWLVNLVREFINQK